MTVDTNTHIITDLVIQSLSSWAEPELGSWIRDRAKGIGVAGKDISGICWAISRYWELCEKRARCWARCHEEFPELLGESHTPKDDANTAKTLPKKKPGKQRKNDDPPPRDRSLPPSDSHDTENTPAPPLPRQTILQHLGRPSLLFHHPTDANLSLLITWRIAFDWTGEAESHLSAAAAFPRSWQEVDERGSLGKVGVVFGGLVERMGVVGAVTGVVGLLFV